MEKPRRDKIADLSRRRPYRRWKQSQYSEKYRQKLDATNCPDRDEIAAAALWVILDLMAEDENAMGKPFYAALGRELQSRQFSPDASADKILRMVEARRNAKRRDSGYLDG